MNKIFLGTIIITILIHVARGLLISPFALCAVNSRARYIRGRGRIVRARSINLTVVALCAVYSRARSIRRARTIRGNTVCDGLRDNYALKKKFF